ncbi:MAG: RsmB/NOP family class I SAM-dependent RNA methyltransferase [Acidobacteria bacterium]|nr:RsmB/NOP family class I SAM-dependent RNA methyltransferase [Acidobacteriota bacterium]
MRSSAERLTAARLLVRVEGGAFSSRLLAGGTVPGVRARVLGVQRWMRALDAILEPLLRRDLGKLDPEVRATLRMGLFETMRMDLPPALATDGAVRLVRRLGCSSAAGMVNAVLRKASVGWRERLAKAEIDVQLAHPAWLWERWRENFGAEPAERAMAAAQEPAATWVWFLLEEAKEALREEGVALLPHPWCPGAWSAPEDPRRLIQEVIAGSAYAQDPSSQLVAHVALALGGDSARLLDLCAAPGGKSALMLRLGGWSRAAAADLRLTRVRLMRPLLERMDATVVVAADATQAPFAAGAWDLVLLDAPCTGTGTFRRHPELKWRLRPEAVGEMAARQRRLFLAGLELVAPGGVLLYATCSVEPEENEEVVADLPAGFERVDLETALPDNVPWRPTEASGIRILPCKDGDGFTMHAVRRSAPA